jgi:hypothetical protein
MTIQLPSTRPTVRLAGWAGVVAVFIGLLGAAPARAAWVWVEGEKPFRSTMIRHPWWYDQVKRDQLSGGDFISHWSDTRPGEASYRVVFPQAGSYEFWVRANPIQSSLSYQLDNGKWTPIDMSRELQGSTNIAADGKPDLRFIAWARVGSIQAKRGAAVLRFRMDSKNNNHGMLDCFVFSTEPFLPNGTARPDQLAEVTRRAAAENQGWFAFAPGADRFRPESGIDLRSLNEKQAGDDGLIGVKDGRFVHAKTGRPVRFWAVNGPPGNDLETLRREGRMLAKHGVNLVRVHHSWYDNKGKSDPAAFRHAADVVEAMKAEGIYCHFSIYFPLWLDPAPGTPWLDGYNGSQHPFAALMFNPDFQKVYQSWWKALLLTPHPKTGKRLVDDPAVFGLEMQNEDSFFFWTFEPKQVPDPQLRILEAQYAKWLETQYGSLEAAMTKWGNLRTDRDAPGEGRLGFRAPWNVFSEKTQRDKDQVRFLAEVQRDFYRDTERFLRVLGFKGLVTASNWATASPEVLGPVEKYTYTVGDFIDRHGYFGGVLKGDNAGWSLRDGHVYSDRSALRFDPEVPGKPRVFIHPVMDPKYDGKPSMISETTFIRPDRYRSEAPLYYAVYGALQGSDAIVHFALDGSQWSVKPNFFMQPWTLMSPAMMGQFPAAALIYRKGLVSEGDELVNINLRIRDIVDLKGTPLPQDAALDELRAQDVPREGGAVRPGQRIDPLVHYAGRTAVTFSERGGPSVVKDLRPYIDLARKTVTSTTGQVRLDFGRGVLLVNAPSAQALSGNLRAAGPIEFKDIVVSSSLELGHVVAVSLDDQPLATSRKILLQVMTEEKPTDFRTSPDSGGLKRIDSIGRDPWLVKEIEGTVRFKRPDASQLKVTTLDPNGDPTNSVTSAAEIKLGKSVVYYLIEAQGG